MNCSCISCDTVESKDCELEDQNTMELPANLFNILHPNLAASTETFSQEDVPDLIHLPHHNRNRSDFSLDDMNLSNEQSNEKLIKLLKSMEAQDSGDSNISYDKQLIKELLEIMERNRNELESVDLTKFLSVVSLHNSENMQVDLTKLKDFLYAFKQNKYSAASSSLMDVETADDSPKKYGDYETYQKPVDDNTISEHHHHHHHYVGEEQQVGSETGHLIAGPHGSLVLSPDTLQPNHEGLVMSYENHPKHPANTKIVLDENLDD